jgi:tripartite-type tricarboxylate transporter receptor subunit TctC
LSCRGGSADILARLLGEHISKAEGPTVIVENRPGGGASIAYEAVARAAPDGNTLVINANSIVIKVNYDPLTSYEPICYLLSSPQVIVVNSNAPYRTLDEFITDAHAKPGQLTFATVGPATAQHIGFEQFKRVANVDVIYVPYPGSAPAMSALLGGHVNAVLANYAEVHEQLQAGKVRALASTSQTRIAPLPDLPTVAELGYKKYNVEVWFGVMAPAKTPKDTVAQLANWFWGRDQRTRGHTEASQARPLSGWYLSRRFRRTCP